MLGGISGIGGGDAKPAEGEEKKEGEGEEAEEGSDDEVDADFAVDGAEAIDPQYLSISRVLEDTMNVDVYNEFVCRRPWQIVVSDIVFENQAIPLGDFFINIAFRNNKAKSGILSRLKGAIVGSDDAAELSETQFLTPVVQKIASSEVARFHHVEVSPPSGSIATSKFRLSYKELGDWSMRLEIWQEKRLAPNKLLGFHSFPFPGLARQFPIRRETIMKLGGSSATTVGAVKFKMMFEESNLQQEIVLRDWSLGLAHRVLERKLKGTCACVVCGPCRGGMCSEGLCNCCRETVEVNISAGSKFGGSVRPVKFSGDIRSSKEETVSLKDRFHYIDLSPHTNCCHATSLSFTAPRSVTERRVLDITITIKSKRHCGNVVGVATIPLSGITSAVMLPVSAPIVFQSAGSGCSFNHGFVGGVIRGTLLFQTKNSLLARIFEQPLQVVGQDAGSSKPPEEISRIPKEDRAYLNVTINKISNIQGIRRTGLADSRMSAFWGGVKKATSTVVDSTNPHFGELLSFPIPQLPGPISSPRMLPWDLLAPALQQLGPLRLQLWEDTSAAPTNRGEQPRVGNPAALLGEADVKIPFGTILPPKTLRPRDRTFCQRCCATPCCFTNCRGCSCLRVYFDDRAPRPWVTKVSLKVPGMGDARLTQVMISVTVSMVDHNPKQLPGVGSLDSLPPLSYIPLAKRHPKNLSQDKYGMQSLSITSADWAALPTRSVLNDLSKASTDGSMPTWWRSIVKRRVGNYAEVNALLVAHDERQHGQPKGLYRFVCSFVPVIDATNVLAGRFLFGEDLRDLPQFSNFSRFARSALDDSSSITITSHLMWRAAQAVAAIEYSDSLSVLRAVETPFAWRPPGAGDPESEVAGAGARAGAGAGTGGDDGAGTDVETGAGKDDDDGGGGGDDDEEDADDYDSYLDTEDEELESDTRTFLSGDGEAAGRGRSGLVDGGNVYQTLSEFRPHVWMSVDRFVSVRRGGVPEHASLLCSLINGIHDEEIAAYVVVGLARPNRAADERGDAADPEDGVVHDEGEGEGSEGGDVLSGALVDPLAAGADGTAVEEESKGGDIDDVGPTQFEYDASLALPSEDGRTLGDDGTLGSPSVSSDEEGTLRRADVMDLEMVKLRLAEESKGTDEGEGGDGPRPFGRQAAGAYEGSVASSGASVSFTADMLHYWVVTMKKDGTDVTFWDGRTTLKKVETLDAPVSVESTATSAGETFSRALFVFNHRNAWVNMQLENDDDSNPVMIGSDMRWDLTKEDDWKPLLKVDLRLSERPLDSVTPYGEAVWPAALGPLLVRDLSFFEQSKLTEAASEEVQSGIENFRRSLALPAGNKTRENVPVLHQLEEILLYREKLDAYLPDSEEYNRQKGHFDDAVAEAKAVFTHPSNIGQIGYRFRVWRVNSASPTRVQQAVVLNDLSWTHLDEVFVVAARVQELFTGVYVTRVAVLSVFPAASKE